MGWARLPAVASAGVSRRMHRCSALLRHFQAQPAVSSFMYLLSRPAAMPQPPRRYRTGGSCGVPWIGSEALGQPDDESSAIQVVGIVVIRGYLLVGDVVDTGLQAQTILRTEHQPHVGEGIGWILDAIGAGATGTCLPPAGGLTPVVDLGPEVQALGHFPVQRGVEHVFGDVVQRLALVLRSEARRVGT